MDLMRSVSSSVQLTRQKTEMRVKAFKSKSRNLIALALLVAVGVRAVWNYHRESSVIYELEQAFDKDKNDKMSLLELQNMLSANGMKLEQNQITALFGTVDDEGDGYDFTELEQILSVVADMPSMSKKLKGLGSTKSHLSGDLLLAIVVGYGLWKLVNESERKSVKLAGTTFKGAIDKKRMQKKLEDMQNFAATLSCEKVELEKQMRELEESSSPNNMQHEELQMKLKEVEQKEAEVKKKMEAELAEFKEQAKKNMQEAELTFKKMERLTTCLKGLDSFDNVADTDKTMKGATRGFSSPAFSNQEVTFGTIEDGKLQMYETGKKLGEGRNSAYRCTDLQSGEQYALKMYKVANPFDRQSAIKDIFALQAEVGKHPRIMNYEKVIESGDQVFVLMELIKGRDLFDVIIGSSAGIQEKRAKLMFKDLVEAVGHLHEHEVIHCDIKPENAMVEGAAPDGERLKLIDFGCSCFLKFEKKDTLDVPFDPYTPPEHSGRMPKCEPAIASDMWRLGCTLFVMLCRAPPFAGDLGTRSGDEARLSDTFYKTASFKKLSEDAQDLISKLIVGKPENRIDTKAVLEHKWLTDV